MHILIISTCAYHSENNGLTANIKNLYFKLWNECNVFCVKTKDIRVIFLTFQHPSAQAIWGGKDLKTYGAGEGERWKVEGERGMGKKVKGER